jgi:hypothetical protein
LFVHWNKACSNSLMRALTYPYDRAVVDEYANHCTVEHNVQ